MSMSKEPKSFASAKEMLNTILEYGGLQEMGHGWVVKARTVKNLPAIEVFWTNSTSLPSPKGWIFAGEEALEWCKSAHKSKWVIA